MAVKPDMLLSARRRGIVKGPLMLEMGVLPDVAAATSATMM
jgi:hypothetical protein